MQTKTQKNTVPSRLGEWHGSKSKRSRLKGLHSLNLHHAKLQKMKVKNMLFLMIMFCSLGFIACDDDTPTPDSLDYPFTLENAREDESITQRIDGFGTYLDNLRPDELEPMSIEDVIWSVEARLNSKYTNVAHQFKTLNTQIDTLSVTQSGGMMNGTDVIAFYNAALDKLSKHFYGLPDDNRVTVVTDVARVDDMPNSLAVITQVGTGTIETMRSNFNLHWWWGQGGGTCGPDEGTIENNGRAANTEIEAELNSRVLALNGLGFLNCPGTNTPCKWYTTSVSYEASTFGLGHINPNDDVFGDNCRDYLVYWNDYTAPNFEDKKCLTPNDMDFYYNGTLEAIRSFQQPHKEFISTDIWSLQVQDADSPNDFHYAHHPRTSYGDIIYSPFGSGGGSRVEEIPQ